MIFYHGSNKLFDNFDTEYSRNSGDLFVSPCKQMSLSYIPRTGGYLYTLEIDESNTNFYLSREYGKDDCKCRAYSDVSNFKIINVESYGPDVKAQCLRTDADLTDVHYLRGGKGKINDYLRPDFREIVAITT